MSPRIFFKYLLCFIITTTFITVTYAQEWRYEISCAGIGVQGTYMVEVTSYGKTVDAALAQMEKDAVHGVLFKGLTGRCNQKPLTGRAETETEHKSFFDKFFSATGDYAKYVVSEKNSKVEVTKVGKREYKVTKVMSVKKDLLRKFLEKEGIIKALGM